MMKCVTPYRRVPLFLTAAAGGLLVAIPAQAQDDDAASPTTICGDATVLSCTVDDGKVIYTPPFFAQFNPITALDMVQRVPGFSIDDGDDVRGFGGAAGNVLIDGQRPSTKSTNIFETLNRIGASAVDYIELIRGGTGGLDVGGQAVVVNVVLKEGSAGSDQSVWEFRLLKRRPNGFVRPSGEISISGRAGETNYTVGASAFGFGLRFTGEEQITRFDGGTDEFRTRNGEFREQGGSVNAKLERGLGNGDTVRLNVEGSLARFREDTDETRFLAVGGPDIALFRFPFRRYEYEVGGDYEHAFSENFDIKLIGVFSRENRQFDSGFEFLPAMGDSDESLFLSDQTDGEMIGRVEFGWSGWNNHSIQFGGEVASNFIDSEAQLFVADDMGVLMPEDIDGANTRVSELRGEPFINDSWKISDKLTADIGFAVEFSKISQSGDNANSRFFTYPKPSLTLTYALGPKTQLRLGAEREVNQLSFGQFVSSVNFDDEDVDFGNPDLQPQRTWAFEASFEQRFGDIGVIELVGFFDYVQDVEDLLPIGGVVEVPGNIGDGEIYGATLNLTAPLDWLYLKGGRVDAEVTQRMSSVTDPVTGLDRSFSFRENTRYNIEFRQDLPKYKLSWGAGFRGRSKELGFGLDELSVFRNGVDINVFVETTVIKGVKARFEVNDVTNVTNIRERTVFDGSRATNPALFEEFRRSNNGGGLRLILNGNF